MGQLAKKIAALGLGLGLAWGSGAADVDGTVKLAPGTQRTYDTQQAVTRAAIGDPDIAGIAVIDGKSLLITAKKVGRTSVLVWEKGQQKPRKLEIQVQPEGLSLQYSQYISSLGDGSGNLVSGMVASLEDHARARALATMGDKPPRDISTSAFENQVQINIRVVEVSRSRLMNAGLYLGRNHNGHLSALSPPGTLGGIEFTSGQGFRALSGSGFLPDAGAFNLALGNAATGLLSVLSVLESNGFAYTLATPTLSVLSGQSASLLAGGELPIPLRSGSGADSSISVHFREFGIKLQVTATVLDNNRIVLKVAPEVSEPDPTLSVSTAGVTVPGFVVRRTETTLMLGDGESFVLSGLFSRNVGNIADKFPGLGDLPILGPFFRSKRFNSQDKELLMVVTTSLVKPVAAGTALPQLPGEKYRTYNPDFGKYLFESGVIGDNNLPVGMSR